MARSTLLFGRLGARCPCDPASCFLLSEMDEAMRSFAEKVFASEVKDEAIRQEISPFDVEEICPISRQEMRTHMMLQESSSAPEKR